MEELSNSIGCCMCLDVGLLAWCSGMWSTTNQTDVQLDVKTLAEEENGIGYEALLGNTKYSKNWKES